MQAAHLTGGVYLRPDRPAALLQYLLAVFLPAPGDRAFLSLPAGAPVDLRASCFCHRRPVSGDCLARLCRGRGRRLLRRISWQCSRRLRRSCACFPCCCHVGLTSLKGDVSHHADNRNDGMAPGGHRVRVQRLPQRLLPARGGVLHMWHCLCCAEGQRCQAAAGCDLEWRSDAGHQQGAVHKEGSDETLRVCRSAGPVGWGLQSWWNVMEPQTFRRSAANDSSPA
jgi:Transcription factor Tfb4